MRLSAKWLGLRWTNGIWQWSMKGPKSMRLKDMLRKGAQYVSIHKPVCTCMNLIFIYIYIYVYLYMSLSIHLSNLSHFQVWSSHKTQSDLWWFKKFAGFTTGFLKHPGKWWNLYYQPYMSNEKPWGLGLIWGLYILPSYAGIMKINHYRDH